VALGVPVAIVDEDIRPDRRDGIHQQLARDDLILVVDDDRPELLREGRV
jgi:hypothetical protein